MRHYTSFNGRANARPLNPGEKALADGETVRDIHWETALKDIKAVIENLG